MPVVETLDEMTPEEVDEAGQPQTVLEEYEGETEGEQYSIMHMSNLRDLGKQTYAYFDVSNLYDHAAYGQFSNLVWPFRYYDEIFDSSDPESLNINLYNSINDINGFTQITSMAANDKGSILCHKMFKNLLFNLKQISFLDQNGDDIIMTYSDIENLVTQENKFFLGKIWMGQKLIDSLNIFNLGAELANEFRGIAFSKHDVGYKYFILSSEPMTFSEYLELLPQSRETERYYQNSFDSVDVPLPVFERQSDLSFIYLKSNYVFQSTTANMSLKGVDQDLSSTETTTDIGVVSTSNTGY